VLECKSVLEDISRLQTVFPKYRSKRFSQPSSFQRNQILLFISNQFRQGSENRSRL